MVIAFENILMTMGHDEYIDWKLLVCRMNGELSKEEEQKFLTWLAKDTRRKAYYERMVAEWSWQNWISSFICRGRKGIR